MPFPRIAAIASTTNQKADGGGFVRCFTRLSKVIGNPVP